MLNRNSEKASRRLRANAVLSAMRVVVGAFVLFVLFRFIVHTLGTQAIGLWSLIMSVTTAVRLGELGLGASSIRFVPMHLARGARQEAAAAASTATLSVAALVFGLCVIVWPLLHWGLHLLVNSPEELAEGYSLLPYAVSTIWLAAVSNSIITALVGCQRADLSSLLQMSGQLLWLAMGLLLVPSMGIEGLALGQAIQYLLIVVIGWILLGRELQGYTLWWPKWSRERLIEMWRYGVTQQLVSLAALLGEPLAKVLLAHFGNLSLLGIFEMANRLVSQLRMLLVSANQVLVPHYADLAERTDDNLAHAYIRNVRMLTLYSSILFSLFAASIQAIGSVWLGREDPWFLMFGLLMSFGWFVNLLGVPAFFFNAGVGRLGINLASQFVQSAVMLLVGVVAGSFWGAAGAACAWPIGLTAGTMLIMAVHCRREHAGIDDIFGRLSVGAMLVGVAVSLVGLYVYERLSPGYGVFVASATAIAVGLVSWFGFLLLAPQARRLMWDGNAIPAEVHSRNSPAET